MSKIFINPIGATCIRLNDEVFYIDFDSKTLSIYNLYTEEYEVMGYSNYTESGYSYSVDSRSFNGLIVVNFATQSIMLASRSDLRHFEYEDMGQQYAVV